MALVKPCRDAAVATQERAPAALLADLQSENPAMRRAAARGLATHPEALTTLCDVLAAETSPSVRAVLFTTLIRSMSPAVAKYLTTFLRGEDAALRNAAVEALQQMPAAIGPHIERLLTDSDSDVRIFAVNVLSAVRHARAAEWLTGVVRDDPHVNVCAAAVDGLIEVGGPEAIPDLEDARYRFAGDGFMEFAIDVAVRRISGR